jgi:GNAT superfamily N-acetyltransferase
VAAGGLVAVDDDARAALTVLLRGQHARSFHRTLGCLAYGHAHADPPSFYCNDVATPTVTVVVDRGVHPWQPDGGCRVILEASDAAAAEAVTMGCGRHLPAKTLLVSTLLRTCVEAVLPGCTKVFAFSQWTLLGDGPLLQLEGGNGGVGPAARLLTPDDVERNAALVTTLADGWGLDARRARDFWDMWLRVGQPVAGVFDDDSTTVVSWGVVYPHGELGALHTVESHRNQGCSRAVIALLAAEVRRRNLPVFTAVDEANAKSEEFHARLGFTRLENDMILLELPSEEA